jgi:hypothetical protein
MTAVVDAKTHIPNVEVGFANIPQAWRRRPNYEQVAERYGWRPRWL